MLHSTRVLIFFSLLAMNGIAQAQTNSTDVLHKTDRSTILGRIDEVGETEVIYFDAAAPAVKKTIAKTQLWKIVFTDGSQEEFNEPRAVAGPPLSGGGSRPDLIVLKGGDRLIEARDVVVDGKNLRYHRASDPSGKLQTIALNKVQGIRFADGREEKLVAVVREKTTKVKTAKTKTPKEKTAKAPKPKAPKTTVPKQVASKPKTPAAEKLPRPASDPRSFYRINLTVGPELAYFPSGLNKDWVSDSVGLGLQQNLGFSLRFDYRVARPVAISLTAGYSGWELVRRYTLNGADQYQETQKLTRIPLQLGVKVYLVKGLYLMPEGGVNLLMSSIKTSEAHPSPQSTSTTTTPITYGASLGYEAHLGKALVELSARYQILDVKDLNLNTLGQSYSNQVQFASVRLGIGFSARRK